jgi:hypothetical protein
MKINLSAVSLLIFSFSLIMLSSCLQTSEVKESDMEEEFAIIFPATDLNNTLRLEVDSTQKSFQPASEIPLILYNESDRFIYFDVSSYVKILSYTSSKWVEVKNGLTYSGTLILSPNGTPALDETYTWAQPVLDQSILTPNNTDVLLRIVVHGEVMEGESRTGEQVAAFVDVYMEP